MKWMDNRSYFTTATERDMSTGAAIGKLAPTLSLAKSRDAVIGAIM